MNYIKNNLLKDEVVIARANLTNLIYLNELLLFLLVFLYLLYVKIFVNDDLSSFLIILPLLLFSIIIYFKQLIKDLSTELIITNKRVLGRRGFIKIKTLDTAYKSIDNVQVSVSMLGRILKYGTITIESKSENYTYKLISNPIRLKKKIMEEIIKNK